MLPVGRLPLIMTVGTAITYACISCHGLYRKYRIEREERSSYIRRPSRVILSPYYSRDREELARLQQELHDEIMIDHEEIRSLAL